MRWNGITLKVLYCMTRRCLYCEKGRDIHLVMLYPLSWNYRCLHLFVLLRIHIYVSSEMYTYHGIWILLKENMRFSSNIHRLLVLKKTPYCCVYTHVKQQMYMSLMMFWNAYARYLSARSYVAEILVLVFQASKIWYYEG